MEGSHITGGRSYAASLSRTTSVKGTQTPLFTTKPLATHTENNDMARISRRLKYIGESTVDPAKWKAANIDATTFKQLRTVTEADFRFKEESASIASVENILKLLESAYTALDAPNDSQVRLSRARDDLRGVLRQLLKGRYLGTWNCTRHRYSVTARSNQEHAWYIKSYTYRKSRRDSLVALSTSVEVWLRQLNDDRAGMPVDQSLLSTECQLIEDIAEGLRILMRDLEEVRPWKC